MFPVSGFFLKMFSINSIQVEMMLEIFLKIFPTSHFIFQYKDQRHSIEYKCDLKIGFRKRRKFQRIIPFSWTGTESSLQTGRSSTTLQCGIQRPKSKYKAVHWSKTCLIFWSLNTTLPIIHMSIGQNVHSCPTYSWVMELHKSSIIKMLKPVA